MSSTVKNFYDDQSRVRRRRLAWLSEHASLVAVIYSIGDIFGVLLAAAGSHILLFGPSSIPPPHKVVVLLTILLTVIVFAIGGLYSGWRGRGYVEHWRLTTFCWLIVLALLAGSDYIMGVVGSIDRDWALTSLLSTYFFVVALRLSTMKALRIVRKRGMDHRRIIVIGGGRWGSEIVQKVREATWLGLEVVGIFDHNDDTHGVRICGIEVQKGYDTLAESVRNLKANEVWICLPLESRRLDGENHIGDVMQLLENSLVTQRLFPEVEEMRLLNRPMTEIMGIPVINLNSEPHGGLNRLAKNLEDRILSLLILVAILPMMVLIALWIRIETKGSILFKQKRHGFDGRTITIYKFRSMIVHDEPGGVVTQASEGDQRVTKCGAFLRRTSLDELPQFFNVLQGRMSIVGPRPHAIAHNDYYKDRIQSYMQRHRVKPGITGWAQINGFRGETRDIELMRKRVNMDMYYIEHWSLWFDLRIIARTIMTGFSDNSAY